MFTGIIEALGIVKETWENGSNKVFIVESDIAPGFKVDESISHDGVCLTVEQVRDSRYQVTAIQETLAKTNLRSWQKGTTINLERSMKLNDRIDGHIVQGHVDATATCTQKKDGSGSHEYTFEFDGKFASLVIEKGSISVNGISLTIFNVGINNFAVAIIPYTYNHTNMKYLDPGMLVNLEFDMIGKYVNRIHSLAQ